MPDADADAEEAVVVTGHAGGHVRVAIIGAGFSGLGAAIRLRQVGVDDIVVFERGADVGGTWRVNCYPGAACDVQSRLYEFSFAPNPDWTHRFARQPEIWNYLRNCADRFGVRTRIRFSHDVRAAAWDASDARWHLTTSQGAWTADALVAAAGALAEPRLPDVPGIAAFAGDVVHTSAWREDIEVSNRRVAVVGTGASAVQLVPAIQPHADHVVVFQRTPPWVVPRGDRMLASTMRAALRRAPGLHPWVRGGLAAAREVLGVAFRHPRLAVPFEVLARRHLRRQIDDAPLRALLTPDYRIGCKRVLVSDDWYPALTRPNVTLVDGALVRVDADSVTGADGRRHPADLLVLATGFRATEPAYARWIRGRGGTLLADAWSPTMGAHLGTTVAGFPNLFVLLGPNTGLGHNSVVLMIEAQIDHLCNAVTAMQDLGATAVEPYAEAQRAFVEDVRRDMATTVWTTGGCDSWYLDDTGHNPTLWPGSVRAFRRRVAPFDPAEYLLLGRRTDGSDVRLSPVDRARGAVGRHVVPRVPSPLADLLAGGAPVVDGVGLDSASALVLAARAGAGPALTDGTPAQARARNRRDVLAGVGRPTAVHDVADLTVDGATGPLAARLYRTVDGSDLPLLVYVHGGGFVLGDLDTHDEICRLLCHEVGQHVLSVAYRLAPEHPFPAARDDVVAALRWAWTHAADVGSDGRVTIGGDSAGANLATVAARHSVHDTPPVAQLLVYPATDRTRRRDSMDRLDGYFLTATDVDRFAAWYGGDSCDPDVSPLRAVTLGGLAPAYTVTAGFDVLRDEGRAYAAALAAAGTPTLHDHEPSLGHGFLHLTRASPAARSATLALARRWRQLLVARSRR